VCEGFVYQGQESPHRKRAFGTVSRGLPGDRFVVCAQNHDQVGNRAVGERLGQLRPGCEHAVAATVILAPAVPMLFMGEEHADPAPFQYFTDHEDQGLAQAVRDGRRREFPQWKAEDVPDPQAAETRDRSVVNFALADGNGRHGEVRRWYRALVTLRREHPELVDKRICKTVVDEAHGGFAMIHDGRIAVAVSLRGQATRVRLPGGPWRLVLDAGDFGGPTGAAVDAGTISLPPWGAVILLA
jgi:maltooligosyltrehalose trehalohydrolase